MPRPACGNARTAIDAPALIANEDFSHRLFQLLAGAVALDAILKIANASFGVHLSHLSFGMIMTAVAAIGRIVGGVTGFAGRLFALVSVSQRKAVLHQTGGSPGRRGVARGAIGAEQSPMDCRIRVTRRTLARRITKAIVDMALVARYLSMFEFKRKGDGVVESLQAIASVVTGETCVSHRASMICDKAGVLELVTIGARAQHSGISVRAAPQLGGMTGPASQGLTTIVALMTCKTKAELIVRQLHKRRLRQACLPTFVIGMACRTVPWIGDLAVQSLPVCQLVADIDVALGAADCVRSPKRRVALVALRFEIRMCRYSGDGTV